MGRTPVDCDTRLIRPCFAGIDDAREFFKLLGGKEKNIPSVAAGAAESQSRAPKALYEVLIAATGLEFNLVAEESTGDLKRHLLNSGSCFVLGMVDCSCYSLVASH